MSLASNVKGKKLAHEVLALALDTVAGEPADVASRFWEVMAAESQKRLPADRPKANPGGPMSDQEAKRFEQQTMRFGQHGGKQIGDVPLSYLVWLDEEGRRFHADLHRYLASELIQRQIEEHEQDGGEEWVS